MSSTSLLNWVLITDEGLSLDALSTWATRKNCGAIVTFSGVVRDNSRAHDNVNALEYETSIELATTCLDDIIAETRHRWPTLGAVGIHHRIGHVELSETSVIVVVSSPHRAEAFDAARYCIDTLKVSMPMWKREVFEGGSDWSQESSSIVNIEHQ